jgi:hypothetical protein
MPAEEYESIKRRLEAMATHAQSQDRPMDARLMSEALVRIKQLEQALTWADEAIRLGRKIEKDSKIATGVRDALLGRGVP